MSSSLVSTKPSGSSASPTPLEFAKFLPYACTQLNAPFSVRIHQEIQDVYISKTDDKTKRLARTKSVAAAQTSRTFKDTDEEIVDTPKITYNANNEVVVKAIFDITGNLVEIAFVKCRQVPRLLLKIISLIIPYHQYLNKISIHRVPFLGICLYELAKSIPLSLLTEITLEDSRIRQGNYSLLLDNPQLKRLSIDRCQIDDDICIDIASKLVHPLPASTSLHLLSLRSNIISDAGAEALGNSLRSNRTLEYLNLAGNRITDLGASAIFNSLKEFNLTRDELFTKRLRLISYLKLRREAYEKCLIDLKRSLMEKSQDSVSSRISKRRPTTAKSKMSGPSAIDYIETKAEMMVTEVIGMHFDPFNSEETVLKGQLIYSIGNMSLAYLNLSYNNLGYRTVVNLANLLQYQSALHKLDRRGLMRVVIEGNKMPVVCDEYKTIEECLEKIVNSRLSKSLKRIDTKKSRIK